MITEYIQMAMRKAKYERIAAEGLYFGKISGFKGLWASGPTKAACEAELRERLDEWIVLSLRMNVAMPVMGEFNLNKALSPIRAEPVYA